MSRCPSPPQLSALAELGLRVVVVETALQLAAHGIDEAGLGGGARLSHDLLRHPVDEPAELRVRHPSWALTLTRVPPSDRNLADGIAAFTDGITWDMHMVGDQTVFEAWLGERLGDEAKALNAPRKTTPKLH